MAIDTQLHGVNESDKNEIIGNEFTGPSHADVFSALETAVFS